MTTRSGHGKLVTVFGGSGFVGRHTVRALARDGWRVRAAVRRPDLAGHLQPMGNVGQIHAVQANVRYPQSVQAAVEGADAVVNLVGILAPTGRQSFDAVHVKGAVAVARAAADAGCGRLVHMSALGANPRSDARYARSKGLAERIVCTGHRSDVREIYAVSGCVLSLSSTPESFGRTVPFFIAWSWAGVTTVTFSPSKSTRWEARFSNV